MSTVAAPAKRRTHTIYINVGRDGIWVSAEECCMRSDDSVRWMADPGVRWAVTFEKSPFGKKTFDENSTRSVKPRKGLDLGPERYRAFKYTVTAGGRELDPKIVIRDP